jgi:hypothetical protein
MTSEDTCYLLSKEIGKMAEAAKATNLELIQAMAIQLALMVAAEEEVEVDIQDVIADFGNITRAAFKAAMSVPELLDELRGKTKKKTTKPTLVVVQ